MKKLTIINSIILMISLTSITPLIAAFFTDINGTYIGHGDDGSIAGGGLTFLRNMTDYFHNENVLFDIYSNYAYNKKDKDEPTGAGVPYFRKEDPVYFHPYMDPPITRTDTSLGLCDDVIPGLNYVMSQQIAFFAKGGYQGSHYIGYNPNKISPLFKLEFTPGVIIPLGKFRDLAETGYGGMTSFILSNRKYIAGLEAGYFYSPEKDNLKEDGEKIRKLDFFPAAVKIGYIIQFPKSFYITPGVSAGAAYINIDYTTRDQFTSVDTEKSSKGFDPMATGSIAFDYRTSRLFFVGLNTGCGTIISDGKFFPFISCGINFGMRL